MKLKVVLGKIFTDRQIIISTRDNLKYFRFGIPAQAMALTTVVGFSGMFVYFMATDSSQERKLANQTVELLSIRQQYQIASADLKLATSQLYATQSELDQQYDRLKNVLADRTDIENSIKLAKSGSNKKSKSPEDRVRALGESLHASNSRRENLESEVIEINKLMLQIALQRDRATNNRIKTEQKLKATKSLLGLYAATKDDIYEELQETRKEFAGLKFDRLEKIETENKLTTEISDLKSRLSNISIENNDLIVRLHDHASENIQTLTETIILTGLNPDKILGTAQIGQGGPFVNFKPAGNLLQTELNYYEQAQKMEASLIRWESLQAVLRHIPLARPVDVGYITSSFGKRRDPMTKRSAYHSGVDIAGPRNSPILATAPGKVTFVGTNGAYGTMVTIEHGDGFKTRYGHLKKALVKKGDKIDFRTQIGVMGSTGRSTGRHVHYEIIYEGKHRNPAKFFKAGKYAFKVTPKIQEAAN